MQCPDCGGGMKVLFTGWYCPRDCDKPKAKQVDTYPSIATWFDSRVWYRHCISAGLLHSMAVYFVTGVSGAQIARVFEGSMPDVYDIQMMPGYLIRDLSGVTRQQVRNRRPVNGFIEFDYCEDRP